jgi:hypothetical protein
VSAAQTERCPGCRVELPKLSGPTHRYIGASPACWAIFSDLLNAGEPPLAPAPTNALIGDAYAAQHPGTPSGQAIQSVAVHLPVLHGVIARGVDPVSALWIRRRALREGRTPKRGRFRWLESPSFEGSLNVSDVARGHSPVERAERAREYVHGMWSLWRAEHGRIISEYYDAYVVPDAP